MFLDAIQHSLARGTRVTYGTGKRALIEFTDVHRLTLELMSDKSPETINIMFQQFALYLRHQRNIQSNTIDQYLSHVATSLHETHWYGADHVRSPPLTRLLFGWHRQDVTKLPSRLSSNIPATAPVMKVFFHVADALHNNNPRKLAELKACAAATYYMALRAAEGASRNTKPSDCPDSPDTHHLMTSKAHFRFPNDDAFYPAHADTRFPPGATPITFDILMDNHKTALQRGSAHKSAHRNPNPTGSFDVVDLLWDYVTKYPPPSDGKFFPTITTQDLTDTMQATARHPSVQLDPTRLTARCMRSGSVSMLRNMKNKMINQQELEHIRDHGSWLGDTGSRIYSHASPDAEKLLVAPSLYDCGFMTLHYLRWFYMTPK